MATEHKISTKDVAQHASPDDCWVVVNGKVYDLTTFAPNHPGGAMSRVAFGSIKRNFD